MDTPPQTTDRALYEADEHAWIARQVEALRTGQLHRLDRDSLAEYLTDMTKSDRRELQSRFAVLLQHLLKMRLQPERLTRSWVLTMLHQQTQIRQLLRLVPSLAAEREAFCADAYADAVHFAAVETGLLEAAFPSECPWTADEALSVEPPELAPRLHWRRARRGKQ